MLTWLKHVTLVTVVFAAVGFLVTLVLFRNMDRPVVMALYAAISAGVAGCLSWALICFNCPRPAWWRVLIAGVLSGLLVHPAFSILIGVVSGEPFTIKDLSEGSFFFFILLGVVTVPSGLMAAFLSRLIGGLLVAGHAEEPNSHDIDPSQDSIQ